MQNADVFNTHLLSMAERFTTDSPSFSMMQMHPQMDPSQTLPYDVQTDGKPSTVTYPPNVSIGSSSTSKQQSRAGSPTPTSVSSLSSITATPPPPTTDGTSDPQPPPAKRRKLTFAEKEAGRQQKEVAKAEKDRLQVEKKARREEEKIRRDEERAAKDEEKRKKNEEREEKRRERELEKQEKEEAKRKKEDEVAKRERAQKRIQSFFGKPTSMIPAAPQTLDGPHEHSQQQTFMKAAPNDATIRDHHEEDGARTLIPNTRSIPEAKASDYSRTFLPFAVSPSTRVAPIARYSLDDGARQYLIRKVDIWMSDDYNHIPQSLIECLDLPSAESMTASTVLPSVRHIIDNLSESDGRTIDPHSGAAVRWDTFESLRRIPIKYIHFHEDVRPPYIGTSTRVSSISELLRLARNPVRQQRPELDYDEDSEAEWEEPEEGEELNSDGESDAESAADTEEMEEFLDDEGAEDGQRARKKNISNDMEPISTGLCWENNCGHAAFDTSLKGIPNIGECRLEFIKDSCKIPFDPFSSTSWGDEVEVSSTQAPSATLIDVKIGKQLRPTLHARLSGALDEQRLQPPRSDALKPPKPTKQLGRVLAGDELAAFKSTVSGSDLTKAGLLAIIKKRFPKTPNAVLSDTLRTVAERTGLKEADKRWQIVH
ncbi:MAG: hypothetical protein M1828_005014 [Chrysothrix sp. TS-e1954]|nr:MAG: hypothetical protein M1828_005014 [Chrysothrix sp. TS-e1954]